jgi:hypothetical protein
MRSESASSCSCMSSFLSGFTQSFWWWGGRVRSNQCWSLTFFSETTLHPWWNNRCIHWYRSEWCSWFCTGRQCVNHTQHQRTIWSARWKGECGSKIQNNATFAYQGSLKSLEAPQCHPVVSIAGNYVDSNPL